MNELAILDRASKAIAEVQTVGEAKDIADRAAALKVFAAKQNWSAKERARIVEIETRAGVRMGELLAEMEKAAGARGQGKKVELPEGTPLLADMGITKKQSHIAQKAAAVPRLVREKSIAEGVTLSGLAKMATAPSRPTPGPAKSKAPERPKDGLGKVIKDPALAAALGEVERFQALINAAHALRRDIVALAGEPVGGRIDASRIESDLKNVAKAIGFARPFTACPMGTNCGKGCKQCRGTKWITKEEHERLPPELRDAS